MARIRSIKPDFFTSEVVCSLPISARLTFVGLWTHADDNGVAIDNPKLIMAAIWPLEDDPRETLQRVSGDLQSLSTAGLITRYQAAGKRYVFVNGWDEHQKVSHPSKPRYPRPEEAAETAVTSGNGGHGQSSGNSPEDLVSPPEVLAPEQGAGSREQGEGRRDVDPRKRGSRIPEDFAVNDEMRAWAKAETPDVVVALETSQFVDHWKAKSGKDGAKLDWIAAWRTWMRNAQKWSGERAGRGASANRPAFTGETRHTNQRHDNPFRPGAGPQDYPKAGK